MTVLNLHVIEPGELARIIPITTNSGPALFISGPVVQIGGMSGFRNIGRVQPEDPAMMVGDGLGWDEPNVLKGAIEYCRELIRHGTDVFGLIAVSDSGQRVAWRGNVDLYGGPVDSEEYPAPKSQNNPGWAEF